MNNFIKHLILATTFVISATIFSQSTPKTPKPSKTGSSSYSYTILVDDEDESMHIDGSTAKHSSSVSVTKSDDLYKFKASFDKSRTEQVKKVILDKLGKENRILNNDIYLWNRIINNDEVFTCKLKEGNIRMSIEKDEVSASLYRKIEALGEELKHVISGSSHKKRVKRNAEHAKRDFERAQRDLERAKRNLERAKREVERSKSKH